jgi:hypothetical protein
MAPHVFGNWKFLSHSVKKYLLTFNFLIVVNFLKRAPLAAEIAELLLGSEKRQFQLIFGMDVLPPWHSPQETLFNQSNSFSLKVAFESQKGNLCLQARCVQFLKKNLLLPNHYSC